MTGQLTLPPADEGFRASATPRAVVHLVPLSAIRLCNSLQVVWALARGRWGTMGEGGSMRSVLMLVGMPDDDVNNY